MFGRRGSVVWPGSGGKRGKASFVGTPSSFVQSVSSCSIYINIVFYPLYPDDVQFFQSLFFVFFFSFRACAALVSTREATLLGCFRVYLARTVGFSFFFLLLLMALHHRDLLVEFVLRTVKRLHHQPWLACAGDVSRFR